MYFVDANGLIAQVSADGSSNYGVVAGVGIELKIENDHVNVVMPGTGEILDSYQLWDSLASLAAAIDEKPHTEGEPMTLDQAVMAAHKDVENFKKEWLEGHKENPDNYPLALPAENSGVFFECICAAISE